MFVVVVVVVMILAGLLLVIIYERKSERKGGREGNGRKEWKNGRNGMEREEGMLHAPTSINSRVGRQYGITQHCHFSLSLSRYIASQDSTNLVFPLLPFIPFTCGLPARHCRSILSNTCNPTALEKDAQDAPSPGFVFKPSRPHQRRLTSVRPVCK